eukprot:TRINITY_DN12381_c0_g1_i1.p1 TRINITY_DN12381_c0_g1~~TRINITY_DN12381_c0_g1_i1.p1  ORF type:complete len:113 (-),score=5.18 TRINITY_DN12381_c0_g1_i1:122-460(-)
MRLFSKLKQYAKTITPTLSPDVEGLLNEVFFDWFPSTSFHRIPSFYSADTWFKSHNMINYFEPISIARFDRRGLPWNLNITWKGSRDIWVKRWWFFFCKDPVGDYEAICKEQ